MKQYTRAMHFDFHTMPGIENLLSKFDAEAFAKQLHRAHVEFINFPARCNIGFSYYNTSVGIKYPGLERDILGEVVTACHKYGIGVAAYINGGLDHEIAADHPELCRVDRNGRVCGDNTHDNFFRTMCHNTAYHEHLLTEIKEILAYGVDGLFVDCMVARECYCPACMEKMRERQIDTNDALAVLAYQQQRVLEMYGEIKALIKDDIYFYINSNVAIPGIHTHAEVECLPSSKLWGSDFFYPASSFHRTHFKKRVYMTGRFQDCWGDFGGLKTVESMQNDLYDAMLSGYDFTISDHLHPVYGLFEEIAERVEKVFEEKIKYEPYTKNSEYISEIGVLVGEGDYNAPDYLKGLARMLCELKLPYSTYTQNDDFSREKLIILPRKLALNDQGKRAIKDFAENGGKLLFCGSALDIAQELGLDSEIELCGEDKMDNAYFKLPESDFPWAMYTPSRLIKNKGGRELARYVEGVFNFVYDGRQSYFYRPQGEVTEYSAAVCGKTAAYICYDAFDAYASNFLKENKLLVKAAIDELLPKKMIECNGLPSSSIASITQNSQGAVLHIKTTHPDIRNGRGIVEDHSFVASAEISLSGSFRVFELPQNTEIEVTQNNGRTEFVSENILGYRAYWLKKT